MNPTKAGGAAGAGAEAVVMSDAQRRMRILREVARHADRDEVRAAAEGLGKKAAEGLKRQRRAQVTGLENAANSALKASDVFDYIKLRTARHKEWAHDNWGPDLLDFLSGAQANAAQANVAPKKNLRLLRDEIIQTLGVAKDSADALDVYLLLIREFVRQFSAEYEYRCEQQERSNKRR